MTSLEGKVALITGTSAGLGAAAAKVFGRAGCSVFGIARDAERMATVFADVPGGQVLVGRHHQSCRVQGSCG